MQSNIMVGETSANRKEIIIVPVDISDGFTEVNPASFDLIEVRKAGETGWTTAVGTMTSIGQGTFFYVPSNAEVDEMGIILVRAQDALSRVYKGQSVVVAYDPYAAADLGLTNLDAAITTRSSHTANDVRDAILNRILAGNHDTDGSLGEQVQLIRKIFTNRLELTTGLTTGNHVLYDDDNTTPLLTWDVTDLNNLQVNLAPNAVARRQKGT